MTRDTRPQRQSSGVPSMSTDQQPSSHGGSRGGSRGGSHPGSRGGFSRQPSREPSREPSLGSTAPPSSGQSRMAPVPYPYPHDASSQTSTGRNDMILGWLMGKRHPALRSSTPLRPPGIHGTSNGSFDHSRSSTNDVSRISYDASGRSTEQTRLSTDMSKNSTLVDSSILRHDRYQTDSTIPSASEIKTASTVLPNDRRSFATDHEIFGAIASKISSKHGSVTGKDTYAMSSRATSVGSLSPIIDEDVASPEQAKQLMEKGFRQYRHCCGRCTFCKLLVMAAFLGILGLMSYGAVLGVRGALGYGSASAQIGEDGGYGNESISVNDIPMLPGNKTGFNNPIHRTTKLRNGEWTTVNPQGVRTDVPLIPGLEPDFGLGFDPGPRAPAPPKQRQPEPHFDNAPLAVGFVGLGVQDERCVTEALHGEKVNEPNCRRFPNMTLAARFTCNKYIYCVDDGGFSQFECPCQQYFDPDTTMCLPQVNGIFGDPRDCAKYWRCEVKFPNVVRKEFKCEQGLAMDLLNPGQCTPKDTVPHCMDGRS